MWLNGSENRIWAVDYSLVPLTIGWFDVSHSKVPSLDSFADLHSGLISYRDAGLSRLDRLGSNSFPAAGGILLLSDSEISEVAPCAFFRMTRLARADLSVNLISSLTKSSLRFSAPWPPLPSAREPSPPGLQPGCLLRLAV